jgi:hypothetical protein
MEITDKNEASFIRPDTYSFIALLDENGRYITGIGIGLHNNGNLQIHFPGSTIDVDSDHGRHEHSLAVRLPEVKQNVL